MSYQESSGGYDALSKDERQYAVTAVQTFLSRVCGKPLIEDGRMAVYYESGICVYIEKTRDDDLGWLEVRLRADSEVTFRAIEGAIDAIVGKARAIGKSQGKALLE